MQKDNAGGGIRGLRATPSPDLLEALGDCYGIQISQKVIDLGGSSNLNLLVASPQGQYVIRVYRPHVTEDRLTDLQRVRHTLGAQGIPCLNPIPARDGTTWIRLNDRLVEVEPFMPHDGKMDSLHRLETALPLLGRIHTILQGVQVGPDARSPLFANYMDPRDALARTASGIRRIRGWANSPADHRLADAAEELALLVFKGEQDQIAHIPRQLVHGDFWDNNVLFRHGQVALVTDFDFLGERARLDDLALTLYFTCLDYPEAHASDPQLRKLRRLVDAYDSGLAERLSNTERAMLPFAMARQPLWSIGGWVALLDDEESARRHATGAIGDVEWGLSLLREIDHWQSAFTGDSQ